MRNAFAVLAFVAICIVSLILANRGVTEDKIGTDGLQNYRAAYHLISKGVFAIDAQGSIPSMTREPLPGFLLAGYLLLAFDDAESANPEKVNGTAEVVEVKRFNLIWPVLAAGFCFVGGWQLTGSRAAALASAAIGGVALASWDFGLNSMYTEAMAGVLMLASSSAAFWMVRIRSVLSAIAFGLAFGLLALTKAIAATVFLAALPLAVGLTWWASGDWRQAGKVLAAAFVAYAFIVGPWLVRNVAHFGEPSIAMRGSRVLLYRSMLNEMPAETYRASFYVWAPREIRPALGALFGFSNADMQKGGAGAALNRGPSDFMAEDREAERLGRPDLATSYLWKMRAEHRVLVQKIREEEGASVPVARILAEDRMKSQAAAMIRAHPVNHLTAMVPLFWRGLWIENAIVWWLGPIMVLALPGLFLLGAVRRRPDVLAFTLAPMGVMGAYLVGTHNLPRYVEPLMPVMVCCLTALVYATVARAARRLGESSGER
ncbi:hypothetical protein [Aquibium oceanicum]|uniref:Glycosyltransferase RgtA/B/C/D-like domain-containing protein n=1 Tax=Aquibium oceanicum TaxID=1670800 RepID=A0A1L3SQ96_9HYPH|nr:hypothetical protein [Aquibium oceanicum]APH71462.1 hypothetical protein BSQ44_08835 [Aquibium oceanicum]